MAHFVLIHGAMHGAWCWYKLVPHLERRGHSVSAVDLPGHGIHSHTGGPLTIEDYADCVVDRINESRGAVLVGHSMGGAVITALAERLPEAIDKLIYLCAVVPTDGQSSASAVAVDGALEMADHLIFDADANALIIHPDAHRPVFYDDCNDEDIALANMLLRPEPISATEAKVRTSPERFGRVPRAYIKCERDKALPPAVQEHFIQSIGFPEIRSLESSHSPFFSMPDVLATALHELVPTVQSGPRL